MDFGFTNVIYKNKEETKTIVKDGKHMKKAATTTATYVIDLTQIEGDGDFLCPNCGTLISPDDESETTYTIQEVRMKKDEQLEELVIRCNKCQSTIHVTGFTAF
jgi:predicted RNA-binding Zn-ribbon protein involved in translation (DUF1610 family)